MKSHFSKVTLLLSSVTLIAFASRRLQLVGIHDPHVFYVDALAPIVIGVSLLCFCVSAPAAKRSKIAISLGATYLSLIVMEIVVSNARPQLAQQDTAPFAREEAEKLTRSGLEVYSLYAPKAFDRLHAQYGMKAAPPTALPLAHIAGATVLRDCESGRWIYYQSDEHGFNNEPGYHSSPDVRACLIGDSFANGTGAQRADNIAGHLTSKRFPTLNLGMPGYGPLAELAVMREYAIPLAPKFILWCFFEGNDLDDIDQEMRCELSNYLLHAYTQNLKERQTECDQILRDRLRLVPFKGSPSGQIVRTMKLSAIRQLLRNAIDSISPRTIPDLVDLSINVIRMAHAEATETGATFLFIYIPAYDRWTSHGDTYAAQMDPRRRAVLDGLSRSGISWVDATTAIELSGNPGDLFSSRPPSHLNGSGYELVADQILQWIER